LRTRRYNAFAYWSAVMMVAVFGTMAADVIHHRLGVSFGMSTLFCASVADWFSKPAKAGGLSYGDGPVAAALLVIALILVTLVAARRSNVTSTGTKSPAWAGEIAE
jgi:uncharacterized membrane-anchored protein